jgi:hypothetical protein
LYDAISRLPRFENSKRNKTSGIQEGKDYVSGIIACPTAEDATYLASIYSIFFGLGSICHLRIPCLRAAIRLCIAGPVLPPDVGGLVYLGGGDVRILRHWRSQPGELAAYFCF